MQSSSFRKNRLDAPTVRRSKHKMALTPAGLRSRFAPPGIKQFTFSTIPRNTTSKTDISHL
ncbi:protein of unknown function [Methylocella tundrae]|uniref:Uncharacterized protein n=1 Tax=Methylocella tundrae TaxID=227605 RepID=A0A4U8Z1B7_METTU|nr:protein of unknown function [Methylocella tundrae]